MLRLWPELARLSLYAEGFRCAGELTKHASGDQSLLAMAFAQVRERYPKARHVNVTVSDAFALVLTMPWQPTLRRSLERNAYARALLRQLRGLPDERLVARGDYRHHGRSGLAYGFDRGWLELVAGQAAEHGLAVRHLMPLSALAYHHGPRTAVLTLRLFVDSTVVTGMVCDKHGLVVTDAEPVGADLIHTCIRLSRRLSNANPVSVIQLSTHFEHAAQLCEAIAQAFTEARCLITPVDHWGALQ